MQFAREVSRALDADHRANLDVLGKVESACARGKACPPALLQELMHLLQADVGRHFDFEEQSIFPRLADAGEGDVAAFLAEEHAAIRAVAGELMPLIRAAAAGPLDRNDDATFRRTLIELVERQVSHIQKETMALLPMLDDLLDDETDRDLAMAYASA